MDTLRRIQEIINYIEDNLTEDISVADAASRSGISSWQFQKLFRKATGDSLGNYIRHRRLSSAAEDLLKKESKIIDIAVQYQFGSQEAFSRAFKKYFNQTPAKFKLSHEHYLRKNKPVITEQLLSHLNDQIDRTPVIQSLPERKIVGRGHALYQVFSQDQDFFEILKDHWMSFAEQKDKLDIKPPHKCYGVLIEDSCFDTDNFTYFSGIEVPNHDEIPEGLEKYTLPPSTYAVFKCRGNGKNSSQTMDYIYGIWLPQSNYKRGPGDDYEYFGEDYSMESEKSYYYYYLPILDA